MRQRLGALGESAAEKEKRLDRLARFVAEEIRQWRNPFRPGAPASMIGDHQGNLPEEQRELSCVDEQIVARLLQKVRPIQSHRVEDAVLIRGQIGRQPGIGTEGVVRLHLGQTTPATIAAVADLIAVQHRCGAFLTALATGAFGVGQRRFNGGGVFV
jgi:hypothetical protein